MNPESGFTNPFKVWKVTHSLKAIQEADRLWKINHPAVGMTRRERKKRWKASHPEKVREMRRGWRMRHPDVQKATVKRWYSTGKGKAGRDRSNLKRRGMPIIFFLNESFPNSHLHHLGGQIGVYIPIAVHRRIYHELATGKGMIRLNDIIADWMTQVGGRRWTLNPD